MEGARGNREGPRPCLRSGCDGFQRLRAGERAELLQSLVLDLPNPLARDVERPSYLVQRARVLAVQSVAKLEHAALARRKAAEHALQRRRAQPDLGGPGRQRLVLVP